MDNLRVLVVDDEIEWINTLAERLELRDIQADFATTRSEALEKIGQGQYDVVVLDMVLQKVRGLDLLKEIKKDNPGLAVILVSGRGSDQDVIKCKQEGAFDYLLKPVQIDDLIRTMKQAVRG